MAGQDIEQLEAASGPRRIPIHTALTRPVLFAGADRELSLANGVICVGLVLGIGISWYTAGVAAFLLLVGQAALARVTGYDPDFRRVYARHIQLRRYYVAAPRWDSRPPAIHAAVPVSA